jgi:hypothetical protein
MSYEISHSSNQEMMNVQELHRGLACKHRNVGSKVDAIWRNFTRKQREEAMRESTGDGEVLMHRHDRGLDGLADLIPEYNLRDMTSTPEHFLENFKFRATTPLLTQLYEGANGEPGDREMMEKTGLRYPGASEGELTAFFEGDNYGRSVRPAPGFTGLRTPNADLFVIPREIGGSIVVRQQYLPQFINHIVEEILDLGSETRAKNAPEKIPQEALATAFTNLSVPTQASQKLLAGSAHAGNGVQGRTGGLSSTFCGPNLLC